MIRMVNVSEVDPLAGIPRRLVDRFNLDRMPFDQRDASVRDLLDLTGVRVAVTGGGGVGLGRACCQKLAALGAAVGVIDIDAESAEQVAADLRRRLGVRAVAVVGSVSVWADAQRVIAASADALGGLDVLINNAGGLFGRQFGPFARLNEQSATSLIERNLLGTMYCTRAALDIMVPHRSGRIINISSEGGRSAMRNIGLYSACKAGVIGFTRSLAHEIGPLGVSTVAVCPGVMMHDGLLKVLTKEDAEAAVRSIEEGFDRTTLGRPSLPDEVANMVAFLATPAGGFVHGTAVSVGGGMSD
jgi:NAD(P)-dependent dehydrogenase (short-subunit alcohol dehydrogenase family)